MLESRRIEGRVWRSVLVLVAVCALTSSLATRFYVPTTSHIHTLKSVEGGTSEPKRQHLDRDATRWVAPASDFSILAPTALHTSPSPARTILPKPVYSDSLYDRPPPPVYFFL